MAETDFTHGPVRPPKLEDFTDYRGEAYVSGPANKIIYDQEKIARLYTGHLVRVFRKAAGSRCPTCTDDITGAVVLTNCPTCGGSGRADGHSQLCEKWVRIEVAPEHRHSTPLGNMDSPGGADTPIIVIGAPLLKDQDLIITVNTKDVYKIVDVGPQIVALQNIVVTQLAQCNRISSGSPEYNLINW